jgi:hypothetical protein
LRVPALVISPWAKHAYIDHQTLSFDAYLKFIEDLFLGGQRLDPKTDGRADSRPDVRENNPELGDLFQDFDFSQTPNLPLILPVSPYPASITTVGTTVTVTQQGTPTSPIPGFPTQSIIAGLLIGLLAIVALRNRRFKPK